MPNPASGAKEVWGTVNGAYAYSPGVEPVMPIHIALVWNQ